MVPNAVQYLVVMGGNEAYNKSTSTGAEFNFYCTAALVCYTTKDCLFSVMYSHGVPLYCTAVYTPL